MAKQKIEIDVDQLLFETVKGMDLDVYSLYKLRNMVHRIMKLSEENQVELFKELELLMEVSK